ncbi:hypothetical protein SAMN02745111_01144 [Eubacterium uniforme]|uniref:Uncharacterized protein n=1 Tax=Eubacterium uniforme TaxID=39495 RepID=A0A1T4VKV0_9FIRM|nr:hypothetical protein [Eubacterium uniforme]SKA65604.1 hypothetical protein SAMN02745111_01144 [Eubacterium uniforme]
MIKKYSGLLLFVVLSVLILSEKEVYAKKVNRHEYWWATFTGENPAGGWYCKENKVKVNINGNKIIVKGKPIKTTKIDSATDSNTSTLKYKKRKYKINSKTKYYLLHWSSASRITKNKAITAIKKKQYQGFQIKFKGKKVSKIYILNHGV